MKAWFYGLEPRERWVVTVGGAIALAIVLWLLALRPVLTGSQDLRTAVDAKQRLLVDVARLEGSTPSTVVANRRDNDQTLVVIVSNTATAFGLASPRTRANGPSGIDVTLQGVAFDSLVAWLVELSTNYGVDVESASVSSARQPGLVNGQVSLHRL